MLATLAAFGAAAIGVPIGYVVTRFRSLADDADRRRRDDALRGRRHGARHRARHRLQQRLAGADRRLADHGAGLHGAEAAVLGARGERDPASDRPEPRGGLDQSRRLAADDLPAPHRAADARRHRRRHGADLRHRRVRAELDRRALQRPVEDDDRRHVPGARGHRRRHRGRRGRRSSSSSPSCRWRWSTACCGATRCPYSEARHGRGGADERGRRRAEALARGRARDAEAERRPARPLRAGPGADAADQGRARGRLLHRLRHDPRGGGGRHRRRRLDGGACAASC